MQCTHHFFHRRRVPYAGRCRRDPVIRDAEYGVVVEGCGGDVVAHYGIKSSESDVHSQVVPKSTDWGGGGAGGGSRVEDSEDGGVHGEGFVYGWVTTKYPGDQCKDDEHQTEHPGHA